MIDPDAGASAPVPTEPAANGWRRHLLSNSLGIVMGCIFLLSWLAQSIAGVAAFNERQLSQLQDPVSWLDYLTEPDFWNRTQQNWQSELLAVFSMAVLAIYLRQPTYANAAPPSPNQSAPPTPPPAWRADAPRCLD